MSNGSNTLHTDIRDLKRHSQWKDILKRFKKRKIAVAGCIVVLILVVLAILAPVIAPYDYTAISPADKFQYPSLAHIFGTDNYGRDIFSRILYGGRTSLLVALLGCIISSVVGCVIGALAGFYGKWVDICMTRMVEILMSIPGIMLAVCVSALLGNGIWQTALAVSMGGIAPTALLLRSTIMSIREREYIEAAGAYGSSDFKIIMKHILPNCLAPIIIQTTLGLGSNILMISGLSFIGLGVQPPIAEWGSMLNAGREVIRKFWPMVVYPGAAIAVTMLGFNLFGDGLRDALDPKQKR